MDVIVQKDKDGKILPKGTLANGNGTLNSYDDNGKLTETYTVVDGRVQSPIK